MKYQFEVEGEIKICTECPCYNGEHDWCGLLKEDIEEYDLKNKNCPLMEV